MVIFSNLNVGFKLDQANKIEMFKIFSTIDFFQLEQKDTTHYFLLSNIFKNQNNFLLNNLNEYENMQKQIQKYALTQMEKNNFEFKEQQSYLDTIKNSYSKRLKEFKNFFQECI